MNLEKTLENFDKALQKFIEDEKYLLTNNLSERCLTHKLAEHLKIYFGDFHIDCEYNKNYNLVKMANDTKRIIISRRKMIKIAKDRINKNDTYSVYPDIIIHNRESDNNHLIIEVKKSSNTNSIDKRFDELKLERFTSRVDTDLNREYRLGIYLEIGVKEKTGSKSILYFQDGEKVSKDRIKNWE